MIAGYLLGGCLSPDDSVSIKNDEEAFALNLNNSPTISGNPPPAVLFGEMYDFRPEATDRDGDSLNFEILNKPNWADFDVTTGRLSGVPTLVNVGTYRDIVISVADNRNKVYLRAFSITVSQSALGSVTLSWLPPTRYTDGSPLVDLAGYKIFYGRDSGAYDHEIHVVNPGLTSYVVGNLVPDTYYFAATSFNLSGVESDYSAETVRTIN